MKGSIRRRTAIILILILILTGCSGRTESPEAPVKSGSFKATFSQNSFSEPEEIAEGVFMDISRVSEGYAGFSVENEKKIKILLNFGETQYIFNTPNDGTTAYIPFPCGDGKYEIRVMQNTVDNKYIELASREIEAELADEFQPFIHSNLLVLYDENSACVKKAAELAAVSNDDMDFMSKVYDLIKNNVVYDEELAETVEKGYVPKPDVTLETGKGICLDYAALAAAMLRSQGVPAKVITGYVGNEALFHAWNAVYLEDSGWIAIELKINANDWTKFDLTYAAENTIESIYIDSFVY